MSGTERALAGAHRECSDPACHGCLPISYVYRTTDATVISSPADGPMRNVVDADIAERNRTEGEGGYTYNVFIPEGTTGVGFTVAALRVGDHAHLDIDSGPIVERRPGDRPEVSRGNAGQLTLGWHEWLVLREILAVSNRVRIAEVERPTVGQMEVHIR